MDLDLNNTTTRAILIQSEDSPCFNVSSVGDPTVADPGCAKYSFGPTPDFSDPSNDYFGILSKGAGNTWIVEIPQPVWAVALEVVLGDSGATLNSNTALYLVFDEVTGSVAPYSAPEYWSATASFGAQPLFLFGDPSPMDLRFYGSAIDPNNIPAGPSVPLVISCQKAKDNSLLPPLEQPPFGPPYPGVGICPEPYPMQPGFDTVGRTSLTAFTAASLKAQNVSPPPTYVDLANPVMAALDWRMQETDDTDNDTIPDMYDNCPYASNVAQTDSGGVNTSTPDGIGDACQCGDIDDDGLVTGTDFVVLNRAALSLPPYGSLAGMPGYDKCDIDGSGSCTATDGIILNRASLNLSPGIMQTCTAANPSSGLAALGPGCQTSGSCGGGAASRQPANTSEGHSCTMSRENEVSRCHCRSYGVVRYTMK